MRRPASILLSTFLITVTILCSIGPSHASSKKHARSAAAHAKARHLARLAVKQQLAWDKHLAKLRHLPHAERIAEKRRERHLERQQKQQAAQPPHARHLAQKEHAALRAHNARLAVLQAKHEASLLHHRRLMAQRALAHQAHFMKAAAAHNARLAAKQAHWVALHGDGSGGHSIRYWETEVAQTPVKVITVDLNDSNVKISAVIARKGTGTDEPFRQMIERTNPNVAVTGTFFSLDNLEPVGDIVIDGSLIHFGGMGTALCITPENRAQMVTCTWGRHHDWTPFDFVCACGPRLLQNHHIVLDPHAERFKDRHMLAPNSRIAVGITPGNKIVFAMTHQAIYLGRMAKVMHALGCSEAMNLDAGSSTGFYYNGATLARPGRKLTNMIVVYGRKASYERALDQLIPAAYRRKAERRLPATSVNANQAAPRLARY